ncbi:hypothetical protein LOK46_26175 [Methylobacterium sp. NMS14P]|uniref:hypothetical protein n=1 Tax=Methylobacterium sp. NMS14P TaxID=2894310 RepID=UPI002359A66D|nr:hypothetical protein [Methylobacterium sp. NMS14P]WCS24576.1 hypothetical protein LOK46_26175 [Methylobacterium sp. NMS14P]
MKALSGCVTLLLVCAGPVSAQTVLAPSGDSAVTQPGGTAGRAARHNIQEAYRNGDVVGHRHVPVAPAPQPDQPRRTNPRF